MLSLRLQTQSTIADCLEKREDVASLKLPTSLKRDIVHDNMTPPHEKLLNEWFLSRPPREKTLYVWAPLQKKESDTSEGGSISPRRTSSHLDELRRLLREPSDGMGRLIVFDHIGYAGHWNHFMYLYSESAFGRQCFDADFVYISRRPPEILFGCVPEILDTLFVVFLDEDWSFHKRPTLLSDRLIDTWFSNPTKALFYYNPLVGAELRYADISRRIPDKSQILCTSVYLNPFQTYHESCRFVIVENFGLIRHEEHFARFITKEYKEIEHNGRSCTFKVGANVIFISQFPPETFSNLYPGVMEFFFIVRKIQERW